jgi:hypothetical protein
VIREGLTEYTTWKRHRVPFEEIWDCIALLSVKGGSGRGGGVSARGYQGEG